MKRKRVVVAMSGGVDSSVAAALLQKQGYEVIGITMCFNLPDAKTKRPGCCGLQGIEDARRVAHALGIRHYVLNMQKALKERVIKDFCREYMKGRTPNPCVRCNQYLKFDLLLKKALSLGAAFLATGHYARITKSGAGHFLKKAKDKHKDQSYFLYRLGQEQLKNILFPLGNYTKTEVRSLARKFDLPVADKPGSQEICFVPDMDYRTFLQKTIPDFHGRIKPGYILDTQGNIIGSHKGIAFYTVGQREGLGIAMGYPVYITKIDYRNNSICVGAKNEALAKDFLAGDIHFVGDPIKKRIALKVKIRYNHKEAFADLGLSGKTVEVRFRKPQFAVTPGQSAVFYDSDRVVGGGIIGKVLG
ncbi:MAG: tRNA 2-thiouridine(34) synthase MnmA [Candidatus Omnitrophica bacterium]|nr:tRNA 2-thiouridine(34) synthase MnmA [Candidatus Omnitrophota bacterium]